MNKYIVVQVPCEDVGATAVGRRVDADAGALREGEHEAGSAVPAAPGVWQRPGSRAVGVPADSDDVQREGHELAHAGVGRPRPDDKTQKGELNHTIMQRTQHELHEWRADSLDSNGEREPDDHGGLR